MLDFGDEGGETQGGYAKTMSDEFIAAEMALFLEQAKEVDIIITTALIPGRKAPVLITEEMVTAMRPGSIVVDLAAEQGGNCAHTQPDQVVEVEGVTILGYTDLTSRLATHASQLFGTNLVNLLSDMCPEEGKLVVDLEDEVVRKSIILRDGVVMWPPPPDPAPAIASPPTDEAPSPAPEAEVTAASTDTGPSRWPSLIAGLVAVALMAFGLQDGVNDFVQRLTVFVLACFVGWQVVWNVTPALHTPLMSVTNAISGIIIVGGLLQVGNAGASQLVMILGAVAILVASINIAGGFLVTQRMLQMFRK